MRRFWDWLVRIGLEAGEGIWESVKNRNYPYL